MRRSIRLARVAGVLSEAARIGNARRSLKGLPDRMPWYLSPIPGYLSLFNTRIRRSERDGSAGQSLVEMALVLPILLLLLLIAIDFGRLFELGHVEQRRPRGCQLRSCKSWRFVHNRQRLCDPGKQRGLRIARAHVHDGRGSPTGVHGHDRRFERDDKEPWR